MASHSVSDSTSEGTAEHSPTSPIGRSSRYGELLQLDAHIARLEIQARSVGQSNGAATTVEEGASPVVGAPFVLAIVDAKQVSFFEGQSATGQS